MRGGGAWTALALGALAFGASWAGGVPQAAAPLLLLGFAVFALLGPVSLNAQILLGAGLGLALGVADAYGIESGIEHIQLVGRAFIAALKMLVAPMILLAIAHGIGRMGEVRALGRLGLATLGLYALTMALAVAIGLIFVNAFQPGAGSGLAETPELRELLGSAPEEGAVGGSLGQFLETTLFALLANPIASIAQGQVLPIVFFALLFGVALVQMGAPGRPLVDVLGSAYQAVMRIIGWFIRIAPIGILALVAGLVAAASAQVLLRVLLDFALVVVGATLFHALVTLPLVARVLAGIAPLELLRALREALVVAFTTTSSVATLPVTTRCVERGLGVPRTVSSFVLPLGATVNMDGTALYEAIAAIFVANIYGIELGLAAQLVVFLMAMLMAVGAPGIPSAGLVTMIVVLEAVGLPVAAVALLISIDRFLDTVRTMTNVEGDAVVAACVAART